MKISDLYPPYMANRPELGQSGLARAAMSAGQMTELSWDEAAPCVLL
jgi:hypothetical protein